MRRFARPVDSVDRVCDQIQQSLVQEPRKTVDAIRFAEASLHRDALSQAVADGRFRAVATPSAAC